MISILASCLVAATANAQDAQPPGGAPPADAQPSSAPGGQTSPTVGVGATTPTPTDQPAPSADAAPPEAAPKPKPPPYTVPWKLRPVVPLTVLLVDSAFSKYEDQNANGGFTYVQTFLGAYKITPELNVLARAGWVQDAAPSAPNAPVTLSGAAFMNPVIGSSYNTKFSDFKLGFFLGVALPLGSGGGDSPSPFAKNARVKGIQTRASMDNAMFAVNDLVIFPGVGFAYVKGGFTAQVEATYLELNRVRGDKDQLEANKRNFTSGLLLGYFVIPELSLGAELHYQRWLNAPIGVEKAEDVDKNARTRAQDLAASARDQATFAVGPRAHFKVGDVWIRPGIAYERGIDLPMAGPGNYHNFQLHVPVIFP